MKAPSTYRSVNVLPVAIFFLMGTCVDLYVPSLPAITHHFEVPQSFAQLTISVYMLGYALGQMTLGILSDSWGRRPLILWSAFTFSVASFLAASAPSIHVLNACRLVQGISIGGLASTARAVGSDCYSGVDLIRSMNTMVIGWALGPIVGPPIGGYLQHFLSWQADFCFFGLYGLAILAYAAVALPETNLRRQPFRLERLGRTVRRMVDHPAFFPGVVFLSLAYGSLVLFNVVAPYLIQVVLGYSVLAYGHIALLLGLGYFLGNSLNRVLIRRFDPMRIVLFGIGGALLTAIAMLGLALSMKMNLYVIIIPAVLMFFFCGHIFPNIMGKLIGLFSDVAGTASALIGTMMAGVIFLLTLVGTTLETTSQLPLAGLYVGMLTFGCLLFAVARRSFS